MITADFDTSKAYKVYGYGNVAWRIRGYKQVYDEDYEWSGIAYDDTDFVIVVMIGDDTPHTIPTEDIEVIPDDAYCHDCGQIGCGHNVYD